MLNFIILVSSLLVLLLGVLVLINDRSNYKNIFFFTLSNATALWVLSNFLVIIYPDNIFIQRTITPTSAAIALALVYFLDSYKYNASSQFSVPKPLRIYTFIFCAILALSFTNFNVYTSQGEFEFGILYYFYVAYMIFGVAYTIRKLASLRNLENHRHDNRILSFGLLAFILPSILTGIILPIFGITQLLDATPVFTLFFFAITTYGILNKGLFDIRTVVWRLLTYVMTLVIIVISLLLGAQLVLSLFLGNASLDIGVQVYYILVSIFMIILFQPLKKIVDKLTNTFFLQAPYSIHGTMNQISRNTNRSIDSGNIEKNVLEILGTTLRSSYGVILKSSHNKLEIDYATSGLPDVLSIPASIHRFSHMTGQINNTFSINDHGLKTLFEAADIGIAIKLYANNRLMGYLILGNKINGSPYFKRDIQLLQLVSDNLALALQNAQRYEEIQAFNETLQNKVNDATKALKRTNKKLIALDDAKDEFISMASHQLRTPLTSVKGYLSMLLEEDLGKINDRQRQALKEAFDSSQRMVFLISDFLNVSRMRTGRFMIDKSPTNLKEIVTEEVSQLKEMAALREQKIIFKTPKDFPTIMIDDNKIRQVMMNMLDNAIFYTPRGGKITVKLEVSKDEISYQVVDEGIGVPKEDQHRLFTKFFRAPNAQKARPDGTGLGLFMAQKIITAQGGSVIFNSTEGKGSTFGFRFPLDTVKLTIDK